MFGIIFNYLKEKKYSILSLKCYECLQKQRYYIKSNCCPIWSLMFCFFSSIKWIFFYNFCRTFGLALQHFLSDIHKKCPIVRQVRRISTPLLAVEEHINPRGVYLIFAYCGQNCLENTWEKTNQSSGGGAREHLWRHSVAIGVMLP